MQASLDDKQVLLYLPHKMVPSRPPFWKFLSEWLVQKDWTQVRLADELGVHQTVVGKWLHSDPRRRTRPSRKVDAQLASVLGVPLAELFEMFAADQTASEAKASAVSASTRPDRTDDPIQSELDTRLAKLGATLSKYPRAVWLAVLEANERMADALAHSAEPPVSASEKGGVSAPISEQKPGKQNDRDPFTLRKRLAQPSLA